MESKIEDRLKEAMDSLFELLDDTHDAIKRKCSIDDVEFDTCKVVKLMPPTPKIGSEGIVKESSK